MINDSISDLFTRIRNACLVHREKVIIPYTQTNKNIVRILMQHGFIHNFQQINDPTKSKLSLTLKYEKNRPAILQLQRLSRPGCRLYVNRKNLQKVFPGQLRILFLSTSQGILSDREAYNFNLGGEILGFVT